MIKQLRTSIGTRIVAAVLVGSTWQMGLGVAAAHEPAEDSAAPAASLPWLAPSRVAAGGHVAQPSRSREPGILPVPRIPSRIGLGEGSPGGVRGSATDLVDGSRLGLALLGADSVRIEVSFVRAEVVEQLSVLGGGELRVLADPGGDPWVDWHALAAKQEGSWVRLRIPRPTQSETLILEWRGTRGDRLDEVVFWGLEEPGRALPAEPLVDRLQAGDAPGVDKQVARPAGPGQFAAAIDGVLAGYQAAYLTYRVQGRGHWTQVRHRINGLLSAPAAPRRTSALTQSAVQVEPISLDALRPGQNDLSFVFSPQRRADDSIWDVALVLVPHARVREVELPTGRLHTSVSLAPGSQAHELVFELKREGPGTLRVVGHGGEERSISLDGRAQGWHRVSVDPMPRSQHFSFALMDTAAEKAGLGHGFLTTTPGLEPAEGALSITYPVHGECSAAGVEIRGLASKSVQRVRARGQAARVFADGSFRLALGRRVRGKTARVQARLASGEVVQREVAVPRCEVSQRPGHTPDWDAPYAAWVSPTQAAVLTFAGATLAIPQGAVTRETRITLRPLRRDQVAPLDQEKTNVTPNAGGYRFGPAGLQFAKPVLLTLPYAQNALPAQAREREIFAFFYDEPAQRWQRVARNQASQGFVTSVIRHFTTFVAGTIATPDAPGPTQFNPTEIQGIELASPSAGIPLMEPPVPSAFGDATLSHPIEVPPGRNGMEPELAFGYSSGRGNGWLGVGWGLDLSTIEIDTRFGVPRYDGSETYLVNGDPVVAVSPADLTARGLHHLISSAPNSQHYLRRREGRFDRIERRGAAAPYHWVITVKNGTQFFYGETDSARLSDPNPGQRARVFRWYLQRIVDVFGNEVQLAYGKDEGCLANRENLADSTLCNENFTSVYPEEITYTHHPQSLAGYRVTFEQGSQRRPDFLIDGRPGFAEVIRRRLVGVGVSYRTSPTGPYQTIRRYVLRYRIGDFQKSLLEAIGLQGPDDIDPVNFRDELAVQTHFVEHVYSYKEVAREGGGYKIFGEPQAVPGSPVQPIDWATVLQSANEPRTEGGLSRAKSHMAGANGHVGIGFDLGPLNFSIGVGAGASDGKDETILLGTDLHGDSLAELVDSRGRGNKGFVTLPAIDTSQLFSGINQDLGRLGRYEAISVNLDGFKLGDSDLDGWSVDGSLSLGPFGAGLAYSRSETEDRSTLADMNGDGFVDLVAVSDGRVLVRLNQGDGSFSSTVAEWGRLQRSDLQYTRRDAFGQAAAEMHLVDPVVRWRAPFPGPVVIRAPLRKLDAGGDGVRAEIYRQVAGANSRTLLWQRLIGADDVGECIPAGTSGCGASGLSLDLNAGDSVFFKVSASHDPSQPPALHDEAGDAMSWQPVIEYTDGDPSAVNPDGTERDRFSLQRDYRVSGMPVPVWIASEQGTVQVSGILSKLPTAEDLTLTIEHRRDDHTLPGGARQRVAHSATGTLPGPAATIDVEAGDELRFTVEALTSIDPARAVWSPVIDYQTYRRYDPAADAMVGPRPRCPVSSTEACRWGVSSTTIPTPTFPFPTS